MKYIFRVLLAALTAIVVTSCDVQQLQMAEPTSWEKDKFTSSVKQAVRKAVNIPGIDNGTTIVVTNYGDTIIAPTDSALLASPQRIVYVTIESPQYPQGISQRTFQRWAIIWAVAAIAGFILLLLLGIFIVVLRRQHARNKAIYRAISEHYDLPESFFTGIPKAAPITVNQIIETRRPASQDGNCTNDTSDINNTAGNYDTCPPPPVDNDTIRKALKSAGNACSSIPAKDLRSGFIFIGLGVFIFLSFVASGKEAPALLIGGAMMVFGIARFIPYLFNKK